MSIRKIFQLGGVFCLALFWLMGVAGISLLKPATHVSAQTVVYPSVFTVTKTADPTSPLPGDVVTYTIAIATDAQTTLTNVAIYDEVPANTTYVPGSAVILQPHGTVVLPASGTVGDPPNLVTAMTVTAESTAFVQFQVQVDQPLVASTRITNTASVTSTEVPTATTANVIVTVQNAPPIAENGINNTDEDNVVTGTLIATDALNGDALTFSIVTPPNNGNVQITDVANGNYIYTPTLNFAGDDTFTFKANDSISDSNIATITVTVNTVNDAPTLDAIGAQSVDEAQTLTFTATATDVDLPADTLTFTLQNTSLGMSIVPDTGVFSWIPTEAQGPGTYTPTFIVSDGTTTDSEAVVITVNEVNQAPVLDTISEKTVDEAQTLTFTATATDVDLPTDTLTFTLRNTVAGMIIDPTSGVFSWTPNGSHGPGIYHPLVIVSDGTLTDSETITITVIEIADMAISKIGTPTANAGETISHTISITNLGPSPARGIVVSDALPSGITLNTIGLFPGDGNCNLTSPGLVCSFTAFAVGETKSIFLGSTLNADTTLNQTNAVTLSAETIDRNTTDNTASFTTNVTTSADLGLSKVASSDTIFVGDTVTFTLTLTNYGPSIATDVVLTDVLPGGLNFESASAGCAETGGTVTCNFGTMPVNAVERITILARSNVAGAIINAASASSAVSDPQSGNNTGVVGINAIANADVHIEQIATPNPTEAGTPLTFTLAITNFGPSVAQNVVIEDVLPTNVVFVDKSTTQGTCFGNADIICVIGSLNPNESAEVNIVVMPNNLGVVNNTATVSSTTVDRILDNNSASVVVNVTTRADLAVVIQDVPERVVAGKSLTYTMTITNFGPSVAQNVILTDNLPTELSFQSASTGCIAATQRVTCAIGDLDALSHSTVSIVANVASSMQNTIVNTATVSAFEFDSNLENNAAGANTVIDIESNLALSKTANVTRVIAGASLTYTLNVQNLGVSDAQNVVLTDTLPAGLSITAVPSVCAQSATAIHCNWDSLPSGHIESITLPMLTSPELRGTLENTATVSTVSPDTDMANNTDTVSVTIDAEADLSLTLTETPTSLFLGEPLTLTFTVTNEGLSQGTGVILTATLPTDFLVDSIAIGQGNCAGSDTLSCTLGSLAPQSIATMTVIGTLTGTETTIVEVSGNTIGTEADPNLANNFQTLEITFTQRDPSIHTIFLPLILKQEPPPPPMTNLSVWNDNTGGDVIFSVLGTGVSCTVGNNSTQFCGSFSPGTYQVQVVSQCGSATVEKTYEEGSETTRVFCN